MFYNHVSRFQTLRRILSVGYISIRRLERKDLFNPCANEFKVGPQFYSNGNSNSGRHLPVCGLASNQLKTKPGSNQWLYSFNDLKGLPLILILAGCITGAFYKKLPKHDSYQNLYNKCQMGCFFEVQLSLISSP